MTGNPVAGSAVRRPSRRALLLGAAGVVGAGIGVGGTELLDRSPDTGPDLASAGEQLMTEHGVLKRILLVYRAAHDRLAAGQSVPAGAIGEAAGIVADYVESFHEGLEEAYVFPRVAPTQPALIRTLLVQHDRGRHLTTRIQALTADGLGSAKSRAALAGDLAMFIRMYEPHEAWEDTVVFPELRRVTKQKTLDELAERFASLAAGKYDDDRLAVVLQRVDGIEEQLGVHDLASFTPALS